MTSRSVSCISKTLLIVLFAACVALTPAMVRAQEPTEEEYQALQNIKNEKVDSKKIDLIVEFLKEKPKSAYKQNVAAEYQSVLVELQKQKDWAQIIAYGNKYLTVAPGDDFTENYLTAAYLETNNAKGIAAYGPKAYASNPTPQLARAIAGAFQKLGNNAEYNKWREKVLASNPNDLEILVDMMKRNMASNNLAQAVSYANRCLKALPNAQKPESMAEAAWKESIDQSYAIAYGVIGANAYQNGSYAVAIKNLDSAVKYYKRYEMAYYYLGMSYWRVNKLDAAMLNFAKAYIIKGPTAASAKQYLDQIWKSGHRNSLAGVNKVIERAQQDLR